MTLYEIKLNKHIRQKLKYYRALYNLDKSRNDKITQEKLAEMTELSTSLIGGMESEREYQGCSIYSLWKISKILGISMDKFFEGFE